MYKRLREELLKEGLTESRINDGLEIARIAYMKSQGIDIHEYLLYKIAVSKKYADADGSGGVSKLEKRNAINNMDIDNKSKWYFINKHK